jgi:hypothetical protein
MTLTRSYPISEGYPTALDVRRLEVGLIVREGVFADPTTVLAAGVAYGNGGWNVGAVAFVAALKRGGAAYSLGYGVARLVNDAAGTAWTIDAAPVSNSRIDLLWIRATDPDEGEATSGTDGPGGVGRAVPVFGYTAGTAASSPVAPALPSGALLIATVTTPSGAASIAGSTIVQSYGFAQASGGAIFARNFASLPTAALQGDTGVALDDGAVYVRAGSSWVGDRARLAAAEADIVTAEADIVTAEADIVALEVGYRPIGTPVTFASSGAFDKGDYPYLRAVRVRCVGGGGAGAGSSSSAAGGGAGGSYAESFILVADLASSVTVTRGAGASAPSSNTNGSAGGDSSFGTTVVGPGGPGGSITGVGGYATLSGAAGDLQIFGSDGGGGGTTSVAAGYGGASGLGYGGGTAGDRSNNTSAGDAGHLYGGGGSGGRGTEAGGAGANGVVIVELFA